MPEQEVDWQVKDPSVKNDLRRKYEGWLHIPTAQKAIRNSLHIAPIPKDAPRCRLNIYSKQAQDRLGRQIRIHHHQRL